VIGGVIFFDGIFVQSCQDENYCSGFFRLGVRRNWENTKYLHVFEPRVRAIIGETKRYYSSQNNLSNVKRNNSPQWGENKALAKSEHSIANPSNSRFFF